MTDRLIALLKQLGLPLNVHVTHVDGVEVPVLCPCITGSTKLMFGRKFNHEFHARYFEVDHEFDRRCPTCDKFHYFPALLRSEFPYQDS